MSEHESPSEKVGYPKIIDRILLHVILSEAKNDSCCSQNDDKGVNTGEFFVEFKW